MQIRIKRIDKTLPLPEYKTKGAAAFDLATRSSMTIAPGEVAYAPLNVVIETPAGYMTLLATRSSLHKRGLVMANGAGIIDQDFCGNNDEVMAALYNFSTIPVTIERGERILQVAIVPIEKAEWHEVEDMEHEDRGGFGTTGKV